MKERIYGYETEYALIIDQEQDSQPAPRRMRVYDFLERLIGASLKILPAVYRKKGIFLENGGLFNYEALTSNYLEGLLEMATPECSTPREVALYHTAQNQLLFDAVKKLNRERADFLPGFSGRIIIGKSNVDSEGKFISSHESYLVDDEPDLLSRIKLYIIAPIFWLINMTLIVLTSIPFILHMALIFIVTFLAGLFREIVAQNPRYAEASAKLNDFIYTRLLNEDFLLDQLVRFEGSLSHVVFLPFVYLFSFLVTPLVYRKFQRNLVSFLVTRIILSGSGKVELPEVAAAPDARAPGAPSIFRISQRSEAIKAVCRIFFDDPKRPLIDLRDILLDPMSALKTKKRIHILMSDTNMSSIGVYLKCGITGLVLEMIEEGISFEEVALEDPLGALHKISHDLTLREKLTLKNGGSATALQIQAYFLAKAKEYFPARYAGDAMVKDILEKWEFVLSSLELNPYLLYRKTDWVTKKDLIEEVLRGRSTLGDLAEVAEWVSFIEKNSAHYSTAEISSPEALRPILGSENFSQFEDFLSLKEMDFAEFLKRWELYHEILKVDFKFHELNEDGYYYRLLKSGLVDEIFTPDEISWARSIPPAGTRASVRGDLVKAYGKKYDPHVEEGYEPGNYFAKLKIGWNKFYTHWPWTKISLDDPFDTDLSSALQKLRQISGSNYPEE